MNKTIKNKTLNHRGDTVKILLESFLSTWAFLRVAAMETSNILLVVIFVLCFSFYKKIEQLIFMDLEKENPIKKSAFYASYTIGAIFTFFYICGDFEQISIGLDSKLFLIIITTIVAIGLFIIFYKVILLLLLTMGKISIVNQSNDANSSKKLPLITFFLCLLGWLPYFLMNYPGVLTPDSISQYAQVIGAYGQSNHHPWIHTQVINLFYHIGLLFTDNPNIAISFYTVFQMCFMALCVSYLIATLKRFSVKKWFLFLTIAFYAVVPYQGMYAVTIWKDVMFAGGVLVYGCALLRLLQNKKLIVWDISIFFLSGLAMCLLRTNGWYIFLLMIPFIIVIFRKQWMVMVPLQFISVVIVLIIKGPVMDHFQVAPTELVESLAIPFQQIARVYVEQKEITEEEQSFLSEMLDTELISEYCNPYSADGFKHLVKVGNEQYLEDHFTEFLELWVEMGIRNPGEYVVAFRDQTKGYWFPLVGKNIGSNEGVMENEFGLQSSNLIQSKAIVKLREIIFKLPFQVPLYGILWSMGALLWCTILFMGLVFVTGKRRYLLIYLPNIGLFLTLLAAVPLSEEFRYAYTLVFCVPLYFIVAFLKQD